jgi:CRP/FNR family cyclic AMP-dependent transcriptional regulator
MFSQINNSVQRYETLTTTELEAFNSLLQLKKVSRKTLLLNKGEVCKYEAFIVKGCIKTYFIDENEHEVILTFSVENWWVSDIGSFHEQTPSKMFIETIEDSELLILTRETKAELLYKVPKFEKIFRLLVQRHLASYQERHFEMIALSAQERYQLFLKKYPTLTQRVPQHLIASYLGVSPEFLSKIRAKLVK